MFLEPIENDLFCGTFQCMAKFLQDLSNGLEYIYLTPVKTQLLQYNLTRDLMLFYHSVKIKA